jgi:hypothetical protein
MRPFSQRHGFQPVRSIVQRESMDEPLRNNLWDALKDFYWDQVTPSFIGARGPWLSDHPEIKILMRSLWHLFFQVPADTLSNNWTETRLKIRRWFFEAEWFEVYDMIEFIANHYPDKDDSVNNDFMQFCNLVLERNISAYRFVGGEIIDITSEEEIVAIEEALDATAGLEGVNTHLRTALSHLSDRESPDYRNSIKESISAVEGLCELISGDEKATLGQALKQIEMQVELHGALKAAFEKLYGYTSDADGIRHALGLLEEPSLRSEDAKFMLVACSAFVNYLLAKASRAGINL